MSELRRLWDETDSDVERALLHAGRSYRCSPVTVTKTMAALGLAGSASVVAMGAAGAAAGAAVPSPLANALAAKLGVKVLIALSAVGVAGVPVAYRALHRGGDRISIHERGEPSSRPSRAAAPVFPEALAADVLDPPSEPEVALAPRAAVAAAASSPRSTRQPSTLAAEISSLDAARSMLARGNAQEALFLLEGYGRGFPRGKLALEAELLRIDALAKNGDGPQARRRARVFLARHPSSVLATRARTYLDD